MKARVMTAMLLVAASVLIGTCGQLPNFGSASSPRSCTSKSRLNSALKHVCSRESVVNEVEARGNRIKYQNMKFSSFQLVNIEKKSFQIPPARRSCRYSAPSFFGGGRHRISISGATISVTGTWIKRISGKQPSVVRGSFRANAVLQLSTSFTVGTDFKGCAKLQNVICQPRVKGFNMLFDNSESLTVKDMNIMKQRMRNAIGGPVCREARALVNNPGNLGSKLSAGLGVGR